MTSPARARELHHDALDLRISHGIRLGDVDSLDALARLEVDAGNLTEAVRHLAASTAGRDAMHYPRPQRLVATPLSDRLRPIRRHEVDLSVTRLPLR